ncbi:gamma-glutamyltransferase family protein [Hydrogenophaga sp.]|uniref:gamma-glutamyltransferase family protein n=1 Tax=Hydrogenophaga sp. TaxID=1904254 RepID=UPI002731B395|nr:gamma-glutamyltransferase family protein [Hydrogenophaga sp.]MDP2015664.1 gamma-glutamyltransferase family protein [Hydrogenophaga sp.]MDP3167699.1 gamma-glutamyltransferase family protein [Hydrogenophaga sp.]MDP3811531.1 gamma-glutamyltransferase family protein [Hydrogenophaga sp.]
MIHTLTALGGMFVAPHHLAAQAGRDVLRDGGNAVEAMVAAAAAIAVVYPHMNAIGGDGFWLIHEPGKEPVAISACGPAAALADLDWYAGFEAIPARGPKAALTVAGTIGGWAKALEVAAPWGPALPLSRLLADGIRHAHNGIAVTQSQAALTREKFDGLKDAPGFAQTHLVNGQPPEVGHILKQPTLGRTLAELAERGLDDFYRGELAARIGAELERVGSPLRYRDLAAYQAQIVEPLSVRLNDSTVYNLPPPTQGLSALMILGLFERLGVTEGEGFAHVHGLVEATKRAFRVRERVVTDPQRLPVDPSGFLKPAALTELAADIDRAKALPWPDVAAPGDTIWMGCIDAQGRAVSFIQSVYWEFGSGVVLQDTGIVWQNRGTSFSLDPTALNVLKPGHRPFHTLNPALALFDDGRVMPYGTMGGEGQPQTQAAVFTRYARFGQGLQAAVTAPRWLLGRTWGGETTSLKLESRFDPALIEALKAAGHEVEVFSEPFSDTMGHAGALVRHPNGVIEGAVDPRSDGVVAGV